MRRYGDCRDLLWRGHRGRSAVRSATTPARPCSLGASPAATDVGSAAATDVGSATSAAASLYPVPSLLTD